MNRSVATSRRCLGLDRSVPTCGRCFVLNRSVVTGSRCLVLNRPAAIGSRCLCPEQISSNWFLLPWIGQIIIIIIINPLTARVVGAPQMTLQPVFFPFSPVLHCPLHSLMLSSPLFLCPPCLLPPFTVPCKMVLARPDERET